MKVRFLRIVLCLTGSFTIILGLQLLSYSRLSKNGQFFIRTWTVHPKIIRSLDLGQASFYFAGDFANQVYLGNYTEKNKLIELNEAFENPKFYRLNCTEDSLFPYRNLRLRISSGVIQCIDLDQSTIYKNRLLQLPELTRCKNENPSFAFDGIPFDNTCILKTFDTTSQTAVLGNYQTNGKLMALNKNILEKQGDGILSVDGRLLFDSNKNLFYYIYFYRNQIICFDSSLQIRYKSFTIDSTTYAKVKYKHVEAGNYTSLSAPPPFVNKVCCVNDYYIFIYSTMISRDESANIQKQNSTIDIYDAKTGRYKSSFYIPDFQGKKVSDMKLYSKRLMTIQGNFICIYNLSDL